MTRSAPWPWSPAARQDASVRHTQVAADEPSAPEQARESHPDAPAPGSLHQRAYQLLREVAQSVTSGFTIYDEQDRLVTCNEAYLSIYDTSRDLIVPGATFEEIVRKGAERGQYPAATGRVDEWVRERVRQHQSANGVPIEQKLDDGRTLRIVEFRTESGYIVGNRVDITDLKEAEARHLAASRYARSLIEAGLDPLFAIDTDGIVHDVNAAAEQITGLPRQALIGEPLCQSFTEPHCVRQTYQRAFEGEVTRGREFLLAQADGSTTPVLCSATPFRDADGRVAGVMVVARDISEWKRMSGELDRHRNHLEELVAERTRQLEEANRTKSVFLANMSHEIRTPMNAVVGLSHSLRRRTHDPDTLHTLDKIEGASNHLLAVINDILDFSKIEAGRLTLETTVLDLEEVVRNVCVLVHERAAAKGLDLLVSLDPALLRPLRGDPTRLTQALLNYASNAVKFTDTGTVLIRARQLPGTAPEGRMRLDVVDTGLGISADRLVKVFDAFEQADSSTSRRFGGTGLGLSITRHIAQLMGGTVGVTSVPGEGSTFWMDLPLNIDASAIAQGVPSALPGRRILVGHPTLTGRQALGATLEGMGLTVELAASDASFIAALAAAQYAKRPFDLLLVDDRLPGARDGMMLAQAARFDAPPALLLTDDADPCEGSDERPSFAARLPRPLLPSAARHALERALHLANELPGLASAEGAERELARRFAHCRLLLAEDNPLNQEVALDMLADIGCAVDVANNGAEALAQATTGRYDLILMDMQMPLMDGLEATRAIRAIRGCSTVPIIAMTANAFDEDRQRCLESGMDDHIGKPVEPEVFYAKLLRWLSQAREDARPEPAAH